MPPDGGAQNRRVLRVNGWGKPANIFATRKGINYDFVKVLGFGLVKDIDTSENARTQLTGEGIASGTPAYLPREITLGKKDADRRADISRWATGSPQANSS